MKISTSWSSLFSFQCSDFGFIAYIKQYYIITTTTMFDVYYYFVFAVFFVSLHGDLCKCTVGSITVGFSPILYC